MKYKLIQSGIRVEISHNGKFLYDYIITKEGKGNQ